MEKYIFLKEKVFTFLISLLLSVLPSKEVMKTEIVENITTPQQVIWVSEDEVLFVKDENIYKYIVSQDSLYIIAKRKENEFVGVDKEGNILLCEIEHRIISSYDEFSTVFRIKEKELYFFETIRPVYMDDERIVAVTALDFLEKHYYDINIQSGTILEKENTEKKKYILKIPKGIQIKKIYVWNEDRYIVEDIFGNLYLYFIQPLFVKYTEDITEYLDKIDNLQKQINRKKPFKQKRIQL